ncbi:3-dehydroquinate synthase [Clostridium cavendishii DSM 21758]|uniref:3-dehydroquinate synthase n=1 Tax=Clostridium cavendishii DSM 21758 TaxID=1121302 RepID=A0A1M6MYH4_9CLOT|nr:3-dehydroquinate synthase [Clostridium cavendishii DSM 21758]
MELTVKLKDRSYPIIIDKGLRHSFGQKIKSIFRGKKIAVITDTNLERLYGEEIFNNLSASGFDTKIIVIEAGEKSKSFNTLPFVYNELLDFKVTRSDLIVAFGGGVVGDLAGFVASTFLRGIDFVQIPTSLLAQVDSSVGGKVAVDLDRGKNLVGSFYHPKMVLIDIEILNTLPERFFYDGMAEVIKYGCIKDRKLFERLESFEDKKNLMANIDEVIYTCCNIKREFVERDERDTGDRMMLNFGHTLGHAIEKYFNYETYTHGEGVAIGMYTITVLSEKLGFSNTGLAERIKNILIKYNLPYECDLYQNKLTDGNRECVKKTNNEIIETIMLDKKNINNYLNIILIKDIGDCFIHKTNQEFFLLEGGN